MFTEYDTTNMKDSDRMYLERSGLDNNRIYAVMDFDNNLLHTFNNEYNLSEFNPDYVNLFKEHAHFNGRELKKLPLTKDVLDVADELFESNVDFERPEKEEYISTREQLELAFHYEMTLLARLEDRVSMSFEELHEKVKDEGLQNGIEEAEENIIEERQSEVKEYIKETVEESLELGGGR